MRIVSVASAVPEHRYRQDDIIAALKGFWGERLGDSAVLERLHARTGVESRHLAFPLPRYAEFSSWGETNAAWLDVAEELGAAAIDEALRRAGLERCDLDALFVVSITGIASPSLDARLINRLRLRPDIKRTPIFGVGCAGGAIGLTRAADYTLAYPGHCAALLAVEACSLTLQRNDLSKANLISTGLFADGAAALIVAGAGKGNGPAAPPESSSPTMEPAPKILATGSVFYPGTEDVMGWDISEEGLRIVLSPRLPQLIKDNLPGDVDAFLRKQDLSRADVGTWVIHTGGPKVLYAIQQALELRDDDLDRSWDCLRRFGNLSSASVLLVLEDAMRNRPPPAGTYGLLLAMGPGFCSEMILLQW